MTKLNKRNNVFSVPADKHPDVTRNEAGGIAFKPSPEMELLMRVMCAMVSEDSFYKDGTTLDAERMEAVHKVMAKNPSLVPKMAQWSRDELYLRSVPMVLLGEFALSPYKDRVPNSRKFVTRTIQRADEITELLGYVMKQNESRRVYKGKLPMVIKYGVAEAFNKFDEYQLAKYNRDGVITLRDAMFLTHPRPKDKKQEGIFERLANNQLATPYTWEVELSKKGNNAETWTELIHSGKVGYMAILRNLRNILQSGVSSDTISVVIDQLTNVSNVRKSKQFPYRFFSAYREIEKANLFSPDPVENTWEKKKHPVIEADRTRLLDAIQEALEISVDNVPVIPGVTFIASDNSGSMHSPMSTKSKVEKIDVATLFSAIMHKKCDNSIVSVFGTTFATVPLSKKSGIIDNMQKIKNTDVDWSTNAYLSVKYLADNDIYVNRIVIFSDMQCYSTSSRDESIYDQLQRYKKKVNPHVFVYSFNLADYGTLQVPENERNVCTLGGYSDKVLSFIPMFERNREDMLKEIEKISID